MTDEERQEIVRNLRNYHPSRVGNWTLTRAADELERLAAEVERLDKACREWRSIAERLRDDLRTGKRSYDFSFLGEKFLTL